MSISPPRTETTVRHLQPYVSPAFRRLVAGHQLPLAATAHTFEAVSLFADMSGFSTLTASLSARGLHGAETLSSILNVRFGRLVDLVHQYGGSLLDFAGDAAVAYWPTRGDAGDAASRAIACAHVMNEVVAGSHHGGDEIQLRIGVGAGQVMCSLVGGVDGRWHALMGGAAWTEMLQAASSARAGQVVLGASVSRLADSAKRVSLGARRDTEELDLSPDLLRAGIPRSIQKRLDAGQQGWLAEFRTVTTVFVNVPELSYESSERLPKLQRVVSTMQAAVHRYGGSVNDLQVDDKGTVMLGVWGIPLHAYEDNAVRAALAAMAIRDELRAFDVRPSIGITTGRAFAGPVGNEQRMRFALFGEPIILAARLMQGAAGEVLCDSATRSAARARVRFGSPETVQIPGRGDLGQAATAIEAVDSRVRPSREMVGRDTEARTLAESFSAVERDGESRVIVVRGEPGIGKSTLIASFLDSARGSPMRVLVGSAESMSATTPYHVWRPILDALGISQEDVRTAAGDDTSAEATRDYLTQRFHRARGAAPLAIVLEDAHWMDSASWSLAAEIQRTSERLLFVIVTRPMAETDMSDDCRRLISLPGIVPIDLDSLARGEAVALACRRLDVDALPPAVADVIAKVAEGHPLFTEQLVRSLLERGVIRVEDHQCRAQSDLALPEFPSTVEGLIRSRIDLLGPEEQFTLKVASVLGRIVDVKALLELHPLQGRPPIEQLRDMARLGLLEMEEDEEAPGTVAFRHGLILDVAYATLSFEQRRRLHHAAGEWYERRGSDALEFALLARHWSEAGIVNKSLFYLERAGEQALRTGNYRETVGFLSQALTASEKAPKDLAPSSRVGVWLRQLGQAYYSLGRLDDSRSHFERATATLGYPVPASNLQKGLAVARGAFSPWTAKLRRGPKLDPRTDAPGTAIYEAATALDAVSAIYYLNGDTLGTAYCMARRFELLNRLVPTDLFARCSAEMAFLWEYAGIRWQADRLFEQGADMAASLQAPLTTARILYSRSVFDLGHGDWADVVARSRESADIYRKFSENRLRRDSEYIEAYCGTFTGAYTDACAQYERLLAESMQQEALLHVAWAGVGLAKIGRRRGQFAAASAWIEQGLDAARRSGDRVSVLMLTGLRATVRAHTGDVRGATEDLRVAIPQIASSSPAVMTVDAYAAVAEAALTLPARGQSAETDRAADIACQALKRATKMFATAGPASFLWDGVALARRSKTQDAVKVWQSGLAAAEKLKMPFEEALIRLELSRASGDSSDGQAHLSRARELFHQLDAAHELRRLDRGN